MKLPRFALTVITLLLFSTLASGIFLISPPAAADTTTLRLSGPRAPDTTNATSTFTTSVKVTNPSDTRRAETVVLEFDGEEVARDRVVLDAKETKRIEFQHSISEYPAGNYFITFNTETETISTTITVNEPQQTMENNQENETQTEEPEPPQRNNDSSSSINPQTAIAIIGGILALVTLYLVWVVVFSGP